MTYIINIAQPFAYEFVHKSSVFLFDVAWKLWSFNSMLKKTVSEA